MTMRVAAVVGALALASCSARETAPPAASPPPPPDASGFLDDYSALRAGGEDDVLLVYRKPGVDWRVYDKVLMEPVTLWRSGKGSLAPIPEAELLRLANDFENAMRRCLGTSFKVVDEPGPGVLLVRLGITEARASDPILDVLTARVDAAAPPSQGDGPLSPELREFIDRAAIEGELRDAQTQELLAQGVDRRRPGAPPITTWGELDRALELWADRLCAGLEARTGTAG